MPARARKPPASTARKAPARAVKPRRAPARAQPQRARRSPIASLLSWRTLAGVLALAAVLAAGYQFWLRESSLVAVEEVRVAGMQGPEADAAAAALEEAAAAMTTLNVDRDALEAAVAGFPTVVGVTADTDFPHGLTITVSERPPVMIAKRGADTVPVAGDGTILVGVDAAKEEVPVVRVSELPASGVLGGEGLELAKVMGAAPEPLRAQVEGIERSGEAGIEATLTGGIPVMFGAADRAAEKWAATAAILADPAIDTLTYIDVRVHERPAVGGAAPPPAADETTSPTEPEVLP